MLKIAGASTLALLLLLVALWQISRMPEFQFFGELVYRVETTEKLVALTFDDGPSPHGTVPILDLLAKHGAAATFFVVGENLERHPAIARRALAEGHELANHSYSHPRMILQSVEFCREQIERTDRLIRDAGYAGEIRFRPPFGKKLFTLPWALSELGKTTVTWDAESRDTATQDVRILKQNVLSRAREGSILLFHDGGGTKPGTLQAVDEILGELLERGFQFVTVSRLLGSARHP